MALCQDLLDHIFSFLCIEGTCKMMTTCSQYYKALEGQREELKSSIPWHISIDQSLHGPRNVRVRFGHFIELEDIASREKSKYCIVAKGRGGPWLESMIRTYEYEKTLYLSLIYEGRFWLPYSISKEEGRGDVSFVMEKGILQDVPYYYTVNIDSKRRKEEDIDDNIYLYRYK